MTNKMINGVPRAYALRLSDEAYSVMLGMVEHCLNVRACMGMDEGFKDLDTEEEHDFVKELRALLAAPDPIVEADGIGEPVAEVQRGPFDDVGCPQWVRVVTIGDFDLENLPDGTKLYSADQLAALQSTIAQLRTLLNQATGMVNGASDEWHNAVAKVLNHE